MDKAREQYRLLKKIGGSAVGTVIILLIFVIFWPCEKFKLPSGIVRLEVWHYFAVLS